MRHCAEPSLQQILIRRRSCPARKLHCARHELTRALVELHRVIEPGGRLLLALHAGSGEVGREEAWGKRVALVATLFSESEVRAALETAAFRIDALHERPPYEHEYQSHRLYAFATRL